MGEAVFARERFDDVIDEAMPLLCKHWSEIATFQDIPLNVDVVQYRRHEAAGALRVYTIRVEGVLVGYACFRVARNAHYAQSVQAQQDVLFLDPEFRGRLIGQRFIRYCDEQLKGEGVEVVCQHVKNTHPTLGRLLARSGYFAAETLFLKRLN